MRGVWNEKLVGESEQSAYVEYDTTRGRSSLCGRSQALDGGSEVGKLGLLIEVQVFKNDAGLLAALTDPQQLHSPRTSRARRKEKGGFLKDGEMTMADQR